MPTKLRIALTGMAAALAMASLSGCATNLGGGFADTAAINDPKPVGKPGQPQKPLRIGMLLPMSGYGPAAVTAKGMKQAGELALFDLDNPLVQLIVKDDKGTPAGAAAAATEAIGEGAEIIVGPLTAAGTQAVAPVARKMNVPVLSFSNDRRVGGSGVYVMSVLPEQEIERIVAFAASQGRRRFAALLPSDEYGSVIEPAFRAQVQRAGAGTAVVTHYPADANAMVPEVRKLMDEAKQSGDAGAPVDTLFIAASPAALTQLGPLLTYSGLNPAEIKVIGTSDWDYPNSGRNPALVGGWYPAPDPRGWQDFTQRFTRSFGTAPPRLASLSYDAVSLAIALAAEDPGQRFTTANMTRQTGFQGIDGAFSFTGDGVAHRTLSVLELQSFGSSVIDGNGATSAAPPATAAAPDQAQNQTKGVATTGGQPPAQAQIAVPRKVSQTETQPKAN